MTSELSLPQPCLSFHFVFLPFCLLRNKASQRLNFTVVGKKFIAHVRSIDASERRTATRRHGHRKKGE